MGAPSSVLTVQADSVPLYMNVPQVDYLGNKINPKWIELTWNEITQWSETGGDDVIYYELSWDQGSAGENWVILTQFTEALKYSFKHQVETPFPSGSL